MIVFFLDAPASLRSILSVSDTSPALGQCLRSSRLADIHQQDSHQHKQSSTHDNHQQRTTIRSHLTTININHYQTTINTGQPSTPDNHQQCSITSEALLWILCSWRSNDIQAILAICRTRVSRTQEARNWTTLFQDASHPPYSGFTRSQYGSEPTLAQSGAGVSGPRIGCLFPLAQT